MIPMPRSKSFFGENEKWSSIKFSNNGTDMLISTRQEKIYVIDSIDLKLKQVLSNYENKADLNIEACFTPDGKYVLSGSQNGVIHAWDVNSGQKVKEFAGHPSTVYSLAFNPRLFTRKQFIL
jgi:COMPASS component SWD2